jgi:hypothetical protein
MKKVEVERENIFSIVLSRSPYILILNARRAAPRAQFTTQTNVHEVRCSVQVLGAPN